MSEQAISYQQMRNEFYEKFKKNIAPKLKHYELQRKLLLKQYMFLYIPCLILATPIIIWNLQAQLDGGFVQILCMYAVIFLILIPFVLYRKKYFKLEFEIQERIIKEICYILGNIKYKSKSSFANNYNSNYGSISEFLSNCITERAFEGIHKTVHYKMRSFTMGGTTSFLPGIIANFKMNKKFNSKTLIVPNSFDKLSYGTLRLTTFEDIGFENSFDVYTNDEVEARYLITTNFMEKLSGLKTKFKSKEISISFENGEIIVSLLDKEEFNRTKYDFTDETMYLRIYDEILSVIKIIDYLDLDQEIGL